MSDGFDMERVRQERERLRKGNSSRGRSATARSAPAATGKPIEWKVAGAPTGDGGGGGRSLLEQIPGAITGAGRALVTGLAPAVWDQTIGNVGAGVAYGLNRNPNDIRSSNPLVRALVNEEGMSKLMDTDSSVLDRSRAVAPIHTGIGEGIVSASEHAAELGEVAVTDKGFDESALGQASKEGRTVDFLLEDVGNLLLAGRLGSGGLARAAGRSGRPAGRMARVAETARKADDAFDKVMLAPLTLPAKGIARGARAAAKTDTAKRLSGGRLAQEAKKRLITPSTRPVRNVMAKFNTINAIRGEDEAAAPAKRVIRILSGEPETGARAGKTPRRLRERRPAETVRAAEGAMFLDIIDAGPAFRPLDALRSQNPAAFDATVTRMAEQYDNPTLTPQAVGMFLDKLDGRLDEGLARDIDRAKTEWIERANEGGLTRTIEGTEVVTGSTPNYIAGTGRFDVGDPAVRAEAATSSERLKLADNLDLDDITGAPARFREPIALGRAVKATLADIDPAEFGIAPALLDSVKAEVMTKVDDWLASTDPGFVRGGRDAKGGSGLGGRPKGKKVAAQFVKGGGNAPLDATKQAALAMNDIRRQTTNQMLMGVQDSVGVKVADMPEYEGLSGRQLIEQVSADRGEPYVAWDPRKAFDVDETGGTLSRSKLTLPDKAATPDAVLVPKWTAEAMEFAFKQDSALAQILIDKPTRAFKAAVLAISGRWHAGNAISGAIMMHTGGVSLADMLEYGPRAKKAAADYKAGRRSEVPRETMGTGGSASERRLFDGDASLENIDFDEMASKRSRFKPFRAVGTAVRKGYDANTFVDDMYRSIAVLKKMDEVDASGARKFTDEQAVNEALSIMGNYDRMTPFERRVVRRVIPFYAWNRHITKLSTKLAIDDPARMTWTLGLPLTFANADQDVSHLPGFLQSSAVLGNGDFFNMSFMLPFATAAETNYANPADFVLGNLNPAITTPYSILTGGDTAFGELEPLSRPDAEYGQNPGSPLKKLLSDPRSALGQTAYLTLKNLPQFQGAYQELQRQRSGGTPPRLFDTGERMQGKVNENARLEDNMARLLGIPIPKTYNTR